MTTYTHWKNHLLTSSQRLRNSSTIVIWRARHVSHPPFVVTLKYLQVMRQGSECWSTRPLWVYKSVMNKYSYQSDFVECFHLEFVLRQIYLTIFLNLICKWLLRCHSQKRLMNFVQTFKFCMLRTMYNNQFNYCQVDELHLLVLFVQHYSCWIVETSMSCLSHCGLASQILVNIGSGNGFLTAPSHCLNQSWLLISEVLWNSSESNFTVNTQGTILYDWFENFKITAASPGCNELKCFQKSPKILLMILIICTTGLTHCPTSLSQCKKSFVERLQLCMLRTMHNNQYNYYQLDELQLLVLFVLHCSCWIVETWMHMVHHEDWRHCLWCICVTWLNSLTLRGCEIEVLNWIW